MKYKLIIFDLDGTVLDTLEDLCDSVNFALKEHSLPERTLSEVRAFVGNGIRRLIDLSVPAETDVSITESVFECFKAQYKDHSCDKTRPYDGITELLERIRLNDLHTAVVSNKADFAVKSLIVKYFGGLFSYSAGEKEGIPRKPAPDMVKNAIEFFGATADETLYVGDSEVDIETAKNSSIDSVIVTWGFRERSTLEEAGARNIAEDVKSLEAFILQ